MVEVVLRSIKEDPTFEVDLLEFSSVDDTLSFTLEVPRGLLRLKKGDKAIFSLGEEEEGDLVMKGLVYKVDDDSNSLEVSFHGLWLRMRYEKPLPFNLTEGQKVYLTLKFTK